MLDTIGNITSPRSCRAEITPDYGYGHSSRPDVVIHQFGSGNAKIEERFLNWHRGEAIPSRRQRLPDPDRIACATTPVSTADLGRGHRRLSNAEPRFTLLLTTEFRS